MPVVFEIDLENNAAEECQKVLTGNRPLPMDIRNKASQNALMIACAHGARDVVEMLFTMDGTHDLEAVDADGWTALHHASCHGYKEIIDILCQKGANPSATTNDNETGLHLAAQEGHKAVVEFLLENNCPLDIQTATKYSGPGLTALHCALMADEDTSLMLIQHGANIKLKESSIQLSALHYGVLYNFAKAVEKLIQFGADVNSQDCKILYYLLQYMKAVLHPLPKMFKFYVHLDTIYTLLSYIFFLEVFVLRVKLCYPQLFLTVEANKQFSSSHI
jgi:ankyrin repeat protein